MAAVWTRTIFVEVAACLTPSSNGVAFPGMIFIEDQDFQKRCRSLLDDDELFAFMEWLAVNPGGRSSPDRADSAKSGGPRKAAANAGALG